MERKTETNENTVQISATGGSRPIESQPLRWGILGSGRIARKFASDLKYVTGSELIAIGSRSVEAAESFAAEFPVKYKHNSYEALVTNSEVDVIYIATPHNLHYENTLLCLNNNKAVLCEKPFAMNVSQAKAMIQLAQQKKVFLMEALWTKFMPHYNKVLEMVRNDDIGDVKAVLANFGFRPAAPVPKRLFDPALGGGTIMDIGIYNVFIALSFLGKPDAIEATMTPAPTGVDEQCSVLFKYKNGSLAQLFSSFASDLATEADIAGNNGRIKLTTRFYEPSATIEFYSGRVDTKKEIAVHKEPGFGYQYEARHVAECLQKGLTESSIMSHSDTILLIEILDAIRKTAGIRYAEDGGA